MALRQGSGGILSALALGTAMLLSGCFPVPGAPLGREGAPGPGMGVATPALLPAAPSPTAIPPTATPPPGPLASANITVTVPLLGQEITSPVLVTGQARTFEANVIIAVADPSGRVLTRVSTVASVAAPQWGSFSARLSFPAPAIPQPGEVRVFSLSPRDGSVENLVVVPVVLKPR